MRGNCIYNFSSSRAFLFSSVRFSFLKIFSNIWIQKPDPECETQIQAKIECGSNRIRNRIRIRNDALYTVLPLSEQYRDQIVNFVFTSVVSSNISSTRQMISLVLWRKTSSRTGWKTRPWPTLFTSGIWNSVYIFSSVENYLL